MNAKQNDPAYQGAIMWHGVALLPQLRQLTQDQLSLVLAQASEHNMTNPLHMKPYANMTQFEIPALHAGKKYSGCQVIAIMVFGLWVSCGEKEELCPDLVKAWPIKDAVMLAPRVVPATANKKVERNNE